MIVLEDQLMEDMHSSYPPFMGQEHFAFPPILEQVQQQQSSSPTPPLDLSQFPATIESMLDQQQPDQPSQVGGFDISSPEESCLVFPHPQPKSPSPPTGYDDQFSPQSIAQNTMQELSQLAPTEMGLDR